MRYQLRQFVHASGERMAVLVDTNTAHPLAYPTLYSTIHHRNSGDAYNTIKSKLNTIKLLLEVCDYLDIPLEERFARGDWLKRDEVELITGWLKKKKSNLDAAIKAKNFKEFIIELNSFSDENSISPIHNLPSIFNQTIFFFIFKK